MLVAEDANPKAEKPKLDVGWVLAGRLDDADRRAAARARARMRTYLRKTFPQFDWRFPTVARREAASGPVADPVELIDHGVVERDARRWDFALVITQTELTHYFKPYALGAPSRAVGVAVASTARIDPEALPAAPDDDEPSAAGRVEVLGHRLFALLMHLLGHLGDLDHAEDPSDFMFDLPSVAALDGMSGYGEAAQRAFRREMHDAADVRLEETEHAWQRWGAFYLRAAWHNRQDILSAIAQIRPWEFPLRFSRLTTAAASTLVVLLLTAEAWELGMSQPPLLVSVLSLLSLGGTSAYLIERQHLLSRRRAARLSEQRVVAGLSVAAAVVLGMAATYVLLFGTTLLLGASIFNTGVIEGWSGLGHAPDEAHYLTMAGFVAALGIAIGALGASFEEQGYFRHVASVDEET